MRALILFVLLLFLSLMLPAQKIRLHQLEKLPVEFHAPGTLYVIGDVVKTSDGLLYRATASTTTTPPGADWEGFDVGGAAADGNGILKGGIDTVESTGWWAFPLNPDADAYGRFSIGRQQNSNSFTSGPVYTAAGGEQAAFFFTVDSLGNYVNGEFVFNDGLNTTRYRPGSMFFQGNSAPFGHTLSFTSTGMQFSATLTGSPYIAMPTAGPGVSANGRVRVTDGTGATTWEDYTPAGDITDDQTLSLNGTDLSIEDGNTVDLSVIQDGTIDGDSNPANELQVLSINGQDLSISNGNTVTLPSGGGGTDSQTLSLSGRTLSILNGNSVSIPWERTGSLIGSSDVTRVGIGTTAPAQPLQISVSGSNFNDRPGIALNNTAFSGLWGTLHGNGAIGSIGQSYSSDGGLFFRGFTYSSRPAFRLQGYVGSSSPGADDAAVSIEGLKYDAGNSGSLKYQSMSGNDLIMSVTAGFPTGQTEVLALRANFTGNLGLWNYNSGIAGTNGQVLGWSGGVLQPITISSGSTQTLSISGDQLSISGGNTVTLPSGGGAADGNQNYITATGDYDPDSPLSNWTQPSAVNGSTAAVYFDNGVAKYEYDGSAWTKVIFIPNYVTQAREGFATFQNVHPENPVETQNHAYTYIGSHHRTYFAWARETNVEAYVSYYDHEKKEFGPEVAWGIPRSGATDDHAVPAIVVANDGHILLFQEQLLGTAGFANNSPIHIRRSTNPEDISSWSAVSGSPFSNRGSYLYPNVMPNGDVVVYMRSDHEYMSCWRSTDNGVTWKNFDDTAIGSTTASGPHIVSLPANNWCYLFTAQVKGGLSIIVRHRNGNVSEYPNSHALFTSDNITYGNWTWWINGQTGGWSKNVDTGGAISITELNDNCLIVGDAAETEDVVSAKQFQVSDGYMWIYYLYNPDPSTLATRARLRVYDVNYNQVSDVDIFDNINNPPAALRSFSYMGMDVHDTANGEASFVFPNGTELWQIKTLDFGKNFTVQRKITDYAGTEANGSRVQFFRNQRFNVSALMFRMDTPNPELGVYIMDLRGDEWRYLTDPITE
ncbi:hypothetical protein [Lewinella sp. W8]|uniref:hypothetical protein n=1 Tax=Lewinella sp. W8 TaxID=2528208 RepID=UPI001067824C|nr:hypothetical protein [Lewinella sp. W8]MTB53044.1 hypothetical protein [Lewinella sp. W8]